MFYSISNCQTGLTGISFGNLLIKQVVTELSLEFPQLDKFVTLSPIPGLNEWLEDETAQEPDRQAAAAILHGSAEPEVVRAMAARYLLTAKRYDGLPRDPVARFHLGNGAEVHEIHAGADTSVNGLARSNGVMVNYLYDVSRTERNHEDFATKSIVTAARSVQVLATAALHTKPKETSS